MEILTEFLVELVIEGSLEFVMDKKVKLPLRVLMGLVLGIVYGGLIALFFTIGVEFALEGNIALAVAMFLLALIVVGLLIGACVRTYRKQRKEKEREDGSFTEDEGN